MKINKKIIQDIGLEIRTSGSLSDTTFSSLLSCKTIKKTILNDLYIFQDEIENSLEDRSAISNAS